MLIRQATNRSDQEVRQALAFIKQQISNNSFHDYEPQMIKAMSVVKSKSPTTWNKLKEFFITSGLSHLLELVV